MSKGAVSYALNGRPGVSEATRERVLAIARELGWYPNRAARALSGAGARRCGLVLARPARILALEPFFMEFIAGVESELALRSVALTIQLVEDVGQEIEVYRRWFGERRVDGVFVMDLRLDDPRIEGLKALGLPAVVVGGPLPGAPLPSVWHDEGTTMVETVRYLAALGHDRIGHVTGPGEFAHTAARSAAFDEAVSDLGLHAVVVDDRLHAGGGCARDAAASVVARATDGARLRQRPARGRGPRRGPADGSLGARGRLARRRGTTR